MLADCTEGVCVIASSPDGGQENRSTLVMRSRTAWDAFADAEHDRLLEDYAAARGRSLDFDTEAVVAVFAGERRSGGYELRLTSVDRSDAGIVLRVTEYTPDDGDMVTQALTYPALFLVIEDAPEKITVLYQSPGAVSAVPRIPRTPAALL